MRSIWRDVASAARRLRRAPGFVFVAVAMLALGIGANTAVFSIINAVLLRPLGARAEHELAFVYDARPGYPNVSRYQDYLAFASHAELFDGVAAVRGDDTRARVGIDVHQLDGEFVSANYFDVLGVTPRMGRALVPRDEELDAEPVVVISDALWQRWFDADPDVIGRTLMLGAHHMARRYTVVGVMGPEFTGVLDAWTPAEYWAPFTQRVEDSRVWLPMDARGVPVSVFIARRRPGVSIEQAQAFTDAWANQTSTSSDVINPPREKIVRDSRRVRLPFSAGARSSGWSSARARVWRRSVRRSACYWGSSPWA